jgi:6,7-dimethyl-8-ribityllumazine synthase
MAQRAAGARTAVAAGKAPPPGLPDGRGLKVVLLRSQFNEGVVDGLVEGALAALEQMGTTPANVSVVEVPGAFELPLAAQTAARSQRCDAIVALGAVIRGETDHYEHIARATTDGLAEVALQEGVPVGFGVLTVAEAAQAQARSEPGAGNKGGEAARAAIAMVHVLRTLRRGGMGASRRSRGKPPVRRPGIHSRGA